jgi:N-acetyl-anhydromuramyl-L-alanine amidase AmpD
MAILKLGSEGQEVADLQARLRELGFDAEGGFGPVTDFAVRRFQERTGLLPDGVVGPLTRAELERVGAGDPILEEGDGPEAAGPPVDRSLRLPAGQFVEEVRPKDLVVLHHTAGASARSTFEFWRSTPARIATAYIVERDGTIFEVFDPRFWAFHLGVVGNGNRIDRRSIGIELASEGALRKDGDDFFAFRALGSDSGGTRFAGEVLALDEPFRNERFFAAYTRKQLDAAISLVDHLCSVFGIPRRTPADSLAFAAANVELQGVIGHHHVRRDKTDLHPGFPWERLVERAGLERV